MSMPIGPGGAIASAACAVDRARAAPMPVQPRDGALVSDEHCDYCGATTLVWRKCKLICESCAQINKSCADL